MLGNFVYANPTKLFFGDEAQKNLVKALKPFGKKVLLTYGAATEISSLGVTPDMLDGIADSTIILTGGYKKLDHAEIVEILRKSL